MSIRIGDRVALVSRKTLDPVLTGRVLGWGADYGVRVQLDFGCATAKRKIMDVDADDPEFFLVEAFKK